MADLATPSAATMATVNAGADATKASQPTSSDRPVKPDDEAFKASMEQADKVLEQARKRVADAQARVNSAIPGKSESAPRQNEIREQLNAIKSKQAATKSQRQQSLDKIKHLDGQMRAKMNDQKLAKATSPYKSTAEVDAEIKRLEASVESGKLKMVDERKAVAEVSSLHKQKKSFAALDERQKEIDSFKTTIAELKKREDRSEQKELEAEYDKLNKEKETLRNADVERRGDINLARDSLKDARDKQTQAWSDRKKLQDEYYTARNKYREYEREAAKMREVKRKQERDEYTRMKRQEALERKLEEASLPAYGDEIRAADSIIHLIDPSSGPTVAAAAAVVSDFAAKAQRMINDSGIKGTRLSSKKEDDNDSYFAGTGGKKGKKGKKGKNIPTADGSTSTPSTANKDVLSKLWAPSALEQFSIMKLDAPATVNLIPTTLEEVKNKRQFYLDDRDNKTKQNVEAARQEFDAYEAQANKPAPGPKPTDVTKNGRSTREAAAEPKPTTNGNAAASGSSTNQTDGLSETSNAVKSMSLEDDTDNSVDEPGADGDKANTTGAEPKTNDVSALDDFNPPEAAAKPASAVEETKA